MAKKTEEIELPKRSTFVDPNASYPQGLEPAVLSDDLVQTIAATRAAQAAEYVAKIEELERQLRESEKARAVAKEARDAALTELAEVNAAVAELAETKDVDGVTVVHYLHTAENGEQYVVVDIDTSIDTGDVKVVLNDGDLYFGSAETGNMLTGETLAQRELVHMATYRGGAQTILGQMERRGNVERAGYLEELRLTAEAIRQRADNLDDLRIKSEIAGHMLRS